MYLSECFCDTLIVIRYGLSFLLPYYILQECLSVYHVPMARGKYLAGGFFFFTFSQLLFPFLLTSHLIFN